MCLAEELKPLGAVKYDLRQVSLGCVKNLSQYISYFRIYAYADPLFLASRHLLQHPQHEEQCGNLCVYVYE